MKNIERYKDKIAEVGYDFALLEDNQIVNCEYCPACEGCKFFDDGCTAPRMKWLLEESILTKEEEEIIKGIIVANIPFNSTEDLRCISKHKLGGSDTKCYLNLVYGIDSINTLYFDINKLFKGMVLNRVYRVEELGL